MGPTNQLHPAAAAGSVQVIDELLSRGSIDINQGNPQGVTPLILAAARGHKTAVRTLLNNGASVSARTIDQSNAMHAVCQQGYVDVLHLLIKAGGDLEAKTSHGYTCLHLAAARGHVRVMKALIAAGAKMDRNEWKGRSVKIKGQGGGTTAGEREVCASKVGVYYVVKCPR